MRGLSTVKTRKAMEVVFFESLGVDFEEGR